MSFLSHTSFSTALRGRGAVDSNDFTSALPKEVPISQQKALTFISLYSLSLVVLMQKAELTTGGGWCRRSAVQPKRLGGQGAPRPAQLGDY